MPAGADLMRVVVEQTVTCADGPYGALADLVVDPASRRLTHLVVLPEGRTTGARLVPLDHVAPESGAEIRLRCTRADVGAMDVVDGVAFVSAHQMLADDPDWDVGVSDMVALPSPDALEGIGAVDPDPQLIVDYDRVPKGDVEIRRSSRITSSDGHHVGHIDGCVVDDDGRIAEILLLRGHLWGRREVGVPIAAVDSIDNDRVVLRVAKDELRALPPRREPR